MVDDPSHKDWWDKLTLHGIQKGVVKVVNNGPAWNVKGGGAFYEFSDGTSLKHSFFITCYHILATSSITEIIKNVEFKSEFIPQLNSFHFIKEHLLGCWTNRTFDVTIIKLTTYGEKYVRDGGIEFIKIGKANINSNIITVLQSIEGAFTFANGKVLEIDFNKIKYCISTEVGINGSPIINWDCAAISIFCNEKTNNLPQFQQFTFTLRDIINIYFDER